MNDPIMSIVGQFGHEMDVSTLNEEDLSPKGIYHRIVDNHPDAKKDPRKLTE